MSAIEQERRLSGSGAFAIALLLTAPSIVAWFASAAAAHQAAFPASSLWFVYEMSLYAGCAGVAIVVGLTIHAAIRRRISRVFVWLMALVAVVGASLLWYASHIYRNPWTTNT